MGFNKYSFLYGLTEGLYGADLRSDRMFFKERFILEYQLSKQDVMIFSKDFFVNTSIQGNILHDKND
ncbi:MAG: hypothetical protein EAZ80_10635 [Runella slithyformis]|nr:MAG: hypothetical protein EAZ80_10635 [Runella slithyformis]